MHMVFLVYLKTDSINERLFNKCLSSMSNKYVFILIVEILDLMM
ncbi:hypothetical protein OTSTA763_0238 [Orientia tsutsugamushi str. TA763]|nr:hypothetical protein OTSTA763_0238 [Orientia tsutsugamushi str. TA763]